MTTRQINNTIGKCKFARNISKLSIGRKTEFWKENANGSISLIARVRCDTVGQRPRKFTVTASDAIPVGGNYTLKTIQRHLFDDHVIA